MIEDESEQRRRRYCREHPGNPCHRVHFGPVFHLRRDVAVCQQCMQLVLPSEVETYVRLAGILGELLLRADYIAREIAKDRR